MFKKWDIIIIVSLIILSFVPEVVFGVIMGKDYNRTYAEITVAGEFYKKIPLSEHSGEDIITIETNHGSNKVLIKDNTVSIIEADCSDSLCVYQGTIGKVGETVVCLPHRVLIEIKGDKSESDDDDVILSR